MKLKTRQQFRQRRHMRVRHKVRGTAECPRLSVMISLKQMYAQLIDDESGVTLLSVDSRKFEGGNNVEKAAQLGKQLAESAIEKDIKQAVFDRGGFKYAGRVKAIAEAVREAGVSI